MEPTIEHGRPQTRAEARAAAAPVFVDPTGTRPRRLRLLALSAVGILALFVITVAGSLLAAPSVVAPLLPQPFAAIAPPAPAPAAATEPSPTPSPSETALDGAPVVAEPSPATADSSVTAGSVPTPATAPAQPTAGTAPVEPGNAPAAEDRGSSAAAPGRANAPTPPAKR
jgi:hypothetical protein